MDLLGRWAATAQSWVVVVFLTFIIARALRGTKYGKPKVRDHQSQSLFTDSFSHFITAHSIARGRSARPPPPRNHRREKRMPSTSCETLTASIAQCLHQEDDIYYYRLRCGSRRRRSSHHRHRRLRGSSDCPRDAPAAHHHHDDYRDQENRLDHRPLRPSQ